MIYTPSEYSRAFLLCNKKVSVWTVKRRCAKGQLPSNHRARKLQGKTGAWIIEVVEKN